MYIFVIMSKFLAQLCNEAIMTIQQGIYKVNLQRSSNMHISHNGVNKVEFPIYWKRCEVRSDIKLISLFRANPTTDNSNIEVSVIYVDSINFVIIYFRRPPFPISFPSISLGQL